MVIPKSVTKIEKRAFLIDQPVKVKISRGNKRYAVKYGSIYSKVSGRLVIGYVKNGELKIPEEVTHIDESGLLGGDSDKIIFPDVKNIISFFTLIDPVFTQRSRERKLTYVFYSKIPPTLASKLLPPSISLTIYVPKNCKDRYMERWKELSEDKFSKVTFIEMK